MADLTLRPATGSEDDCRAILAFLKGMQAEGLIDEPDDAMTLKEIWRVATEEAAWMVHEGDRLVGSLGLTKASFWYTQRQSIVSRWCYVAPEARAAHVLDLMLAEAADLASVSGMIVFVDLFNPTKRRRIVKAAERIGFVPEGARVALLPALEG